ncbi:S1C family serine protease [Schlesneria paludicola]|uniref:S1C family serine protease n=1 Tax=Schlesneria paludicola TaxID=360056 RepID=UPI00029A2B30|nr:S1C family serine protease [Schlesneria paludicola]
MNSSRVTIPAFQTWQQLMTARHQRSSYPAFLIRSLPILAIMSVLLTSSTTASAQSMSGTIGRVAPKVVKIFGAGGGKNLYSYGSGFLVSPQGHIVTAQSHILDSDTVAVVLHDGRRFEGKVIAAEPPLDMALLKIEAEGLPYFDLTQATTAAPGSRVLGFSNAFKVATGDEPVSVIHGVIAAKTNLTARRGAFESPYTGPVYVVDAVTNNSGAAGGVLTTWDGRLIGMIGKELRNTQTNTWLNYVMPIEELRETIDQIIAGRFSSKKPDDENEDGIVKARPRRYEAADFGFVTIPDVVARTPAYIDRVLPGSLAEAAGLKPNDLILFVGDLLVPSCRILQDELGRLESGDQLKLVVRRDDKLVTFTLAVPKKEEE